MSSLVLLYSARTWYGTWLGPVVWGGLVSRSLLRICPRTASTLFFFMWSMSTVVQVDNDRVIVTQSDRRKNKSALTRFIFHCAFVYSQCLSSKRRQNKVPNWIKLLFSFHSGREWVLFLEDSHFFFKCYVIFAKSAFAWEQIRAILKKKGLNSSLKVFFLKFIPLCLMQTFLLSLPCSQCTAVQSLHCIGLFPSTCALEPVRLSDSSLQLSLKHTPTRYALTYTLSRAVTFLLGGAPSYYLFSENERILLWEEFYPTPAVALDFHIEKHA